MKTQAQQVTIRTLIPEPGHYLTQADPGIRDIDRIITEKVYLAANDSPENWREITEAEADEITARRDASMAVPPAQSAAG